MRIGRVAVAHPFTLAPLEEHSNYPFRVLMRQYGASLVCSERVDAAEVAQGDRRALRLLHTTPAEAPRAAQLSGADAEIMAQAARTVEQLGFDLVDLNFACPVRRSLARGEGGALMGDPGAVARIVAAVVRSVGIPAMIKIRSGPDAEQETAADVARAAADAGAAAVCVHARSVAQGYLGAAKWDIITRVKQSVTIPVIGNGGIRQASDALAMLRETGADGVSIARGCLGNPWIFRQAKARAAGGSSDREPTAAERGRALVQLVEGEYHLYGPPLTLRRLSRTSGYFAQFLPDPAPFRSAVKAIKNLAQFRRLVREHFG